ncbi:hypothetical protein [Myroides fluvii]|uniref:hypothetical protein n=1 Tax=Myroides fluvii TaxID=2572594 RepID=UPI00131B9C7F|nr:hypothetical protein [Myroides fluvii]
MNQILKFSKTVGLILLLGLTIVACSSSDDNGGSEDVKFLENVPKGEIVPTAQRFMTLTGYDENATTKAMATTAFNAGAQKWWSKVKIGAVYGTEKTEHQADYLFWAFYPNGKIYFKYLPGDTPIEYADWRWTDSSKSKVTLSFSTHDEELEYKFTELNSSGFIYAHIVSKDGFTSVLWEQYKAGK